jgi:hypothetical protein
MKRGACAPLFVLYVLYTGRKKFGFSLGLQQLHTQQLQHN